MAPVDAHEMHRGAARLVGGDLAAHRKWSQAAGIHGLAGRDGTLRWGAKAIPVITDLLIVAAVSPLLGLMTATSRPLTIAVATIALPVVGGLAGLYDSAPLDPVARLRARALAAMGFGLTCLLVDNAFARSGTWLSVAAQMAAIVVLAEYAETAARAVLGGLRPCAWLPAVALPAAVVPTPATAQPKASRRMQILLKRALDLSIALPLTLLTLPLIGVLAIAIKLLDPGPAFFIQMRVGRDGRLFPMLKLRSMYTDAEQRLQQVLQVDAKAQREWERYCKLSNDPRILPYVGNLIRRLSLDELPQLWNVIHNDMSLVGPRPFPLYHIQRFPCEFQVIRASVMPGITGFWQVLSRSNGDLSVQQQLDLDYIRGWSLWLDLHILIQTPSAVLRMSGAK
jgi:lipopolysaccharide/colanic/teichoic acid biosynthesis glycosyltransferase